jgi:hypothetical protein
MGLTTSFIAFQERVRKMASKAIAHALWSVIASGAKNSRPSVETSSSHRSYLETCRCGDFLKR